MYKIIMALVLLCLTACSSTGTPPTEKLPDNEPKLLFRMEPKYPKKAFEHGIEGCVVLKFDVTQEGKTENIRVIESKPLRIFDKSAVRALSKWRYEPKAQLGESVRVNDLTVALDFQLKKRR